MDSSQDGRVGDFVFTSSHKHAKITTKLERNHRWKPTENLLKRIFITKDIVKEDTTLRLVDGQEQEITGKKSWKADKQLLKLMFNLITN